MLDMLYYFMFFYGGAKMFHECLKKTNSLSPMQISQINFMLKNPLRADFSLLTSSMASTLIDGISELQLQCRADIEGKLTSPSKIDDVRFRGYAKRSDSMWARKISIPSNMQHAKITTIEMIREDLHKAGCDFARLDSQAMERLVALYLLTEALVLHECGVCKLIQYGRTFTLEKIPEFERALHTHWFCNMMNVMSKQSDIIDIENVILEAHSRGQTVLQFFCEQPNLLHRLMIVQVDKVLSLNARFLHSLPAASHKSLEVCLERARVATLLYLVWTEVLLDDRYGAQDAPPEIELTASNLAQLEIPQGIWNGMLSLSEKKPTHDKLVFTRGGDLYQLGPLSLDQMLVQYCMEALVNVGDLFGDWFDKEYIYSCIDGDVPKSRYRVFIGGKAKERMEEKYDIDLIIEDVEADRLMLCQVKYRHKPDLPFFRSHWQEFFMGSMINGGLKQLTALAGSLNDPALVDLVRTRTGRRDITAEYLKCRSSLVLLHNVNGLGFGKYDGFLLYDWPTLRNLLRRRIGQSSRDDPEIITKNYPSRVPLEDIEATIVHMSDHVLNHPNSIDLKSEWNLFRRANMQIDWRVRPEKKGLRPAPKRRYSVVMPFI
jgi:hypothetical protein